MEDVSEAGLVCMLAQEREGTSPLIYEEVRTLCNPLIKWPNFHFYRKYLYVGMLRGGSMLNEGCSTI